jgi:hypothetical protein
MGCAKNSGHGKIMALNQLIQWSYKLQKCEPFRTLASAVQEEFIFWKSIL